MRRINFYKFLLLVNLFSIPFISIGQNIKIIWAPVGATWEYQVNSISGSYCCCKLKVEKDTLILGKISKKIVGDCPVFGGVFPSAYYLYQNGNKLE